jgi:uncharacterized protein YacL
MQKMQNKKEERKNKNLVVTFRIFQAIFFGLFALGLSLISGDYVKYIQSPISSLSLTTTIFGLIGAIITGILAKNCEDW